MLTPKRTPQSADGGRVEGQVNLGVGHLGVGHLGVGVEGEGEYSVKDIPTGPLNF